jgi:ribosomal protein S1
MGNPPPAKPEDVLAVGDTVMAEIIAFEPGRQRMGLALKSASEGQGDQVTVEAEAQPELVEEAPIEEPVAEADVV